MNIQRSEQYEIVVIGGGPAGVCAAVSAARKKKKVLLVEKYGFLGGVGTAAMFSPWRGFFAGQRKIIGGLADEIVRRLTERNGSPGHIEEIDTMVTPFDAETAKFVYQEMVLESGVDLLLHSEFIGVDRADRKIKSILLHCREGIVRIFGKVFIDASGIGDVAAASGIPCTKNPNPVSYRFSMTGINVDELFNFAQAQKWDFLKIYRDENRYFHLNGFTSIAKQWYSEHPELHSSGLIEVTSDIVSGNGIVSMMPIAGVDPTNMESVSGAGIITQTVPSAAARFLQENVPGFSAAHILVTPAQFGYHSPRRVNGIIPLTYPKIMSGESYYDSAGSFSLPGSIKATFQVSKRSMLNVSVDNLITTGRAILPLIALYATNNQPASMKLGECAGLLAATM